MSSAGALPANVQMAAVAVCRDALHWRDDLRAIFSIAGVPRDLYDRYDGPDGGSKAKIAHKILYDLCTRGAAGYAIQRRIVEELCRLDKPHRDAVDQDAGKRALRELKDAATRAQILVSPEKAAADARRAANQRKSTAAEERRAKLGNLQERFLALATAAPSTIAERQRRGYDLERLLADLFRVFGIDYRPSYQSASEQIDGAFHFRGFTYLTEVKWREQHPDLGDLAKFKFKVDGKMESTRGLFISMAGYDRNVIEHVMNISRGTRNNVVLVDGREIARLYEGGIGLIDLLTAKVDAAEQEGKMWLEL